MACLSSNIAKPKGSVANFARISSSCLQPLFPSALSQVVEESEMAPLAKDVLHFKEETYSDEPWTRARGKRVQSKRKFVIEATVEPQASAMQKDEAIRTRKATTQTQSRRNLGGCPCSFQYQRRPSRSCGIPFIHFRFLAITGISSSNSFASALAFFSLRALCSVLQVSRDAVCSNNGDFLRLPLLLS